MGRYDLYKGDSSDEEVENLINSEPQQVSIFKIGRFLSDIGQVMLGSVRGAYIEKKSALQQKLPYQETIIDLNIDKKLLENYLLYKQNSKNPDPILEQNFISHNQNLSESYPGLINEVNDEKNFFSTNFTAFTESIVSGLQEFIMYEHDIGALSPLLNENQYDRIDFLIHVLRKNTYLLPSSNLENLTTAIQEMIYLDDKPLQDLLISSMINIVKVDIQDDLQVKEFIKIAVKKYVDGLYNDKSIINIYSDFTTYGIAAVPSSVTEFYKKFFNTSVLKNREDFVRNTNDDMNDLYSARFLLEWINMENGVINSELILQRPKETFVGSFKDTLVNFLLEHKILRGIVKEHGIKQKGNVITHNKKLPISQTDEIVKIYSTGARTDLRCVAHGQDAPYVAIAKELQDSGIEAVQLKRYLQQIIHGEGFEGFKKNEQLSNDNKIFLYKLADLLFNLEAQRNVGAFITNAMFFDLVANGNYSIMDLPYKLPMTLKGAVHASRHKAGKSGFLKINHKFDYIESNADIFKFLELEVRNCQVLFDWLNRDAAMQEDNQPLITLRRLLDIIPQIDELLQQPKISKKRTQKQDEKKQQVSSLEGFIKKLEKLTGANEAGKVIAKYFEESETLTRVHQKFDDSHPQGVYKRPKKGESTTEAYKPFKKMVLNKIEGFIKEQYKELCNKIDSNTLQHAIHNLLDEWYGIEIPSEYLQLFDRGADTTVLFSDLSPDIDYEAEIQGADDQKVPDAPE